MSDRNKWDQFVRATYRKLWGAVWRWTRNRELANDFTQSAFEAALACPGFDPCRSDAFGFLRQKAWWLVQSYRRRRRIALLPPEVVDESAARERAAAEVREVVRVAVDGLTGRKREVVRRYLAGMTADEIAADLGLPIKAVYSQFHTAKAVLRDLLRCEMTC